MKKLFAITLSIIIMVTMFVSCNDKYKTDNNGDDTVWYTNSEKIADYSYDGYLGSWIWGQNYGDDVYDRTVTISLINAEQVVFSVNYYKTWDSGTAIAKIDDKDEKAYFTTEGDEYIKGWFYIEGRTLIFNIIESNAPYIGSETTSYAKLSIYDSNTTTETPNNVGETIIIPNDDNDEKAASNAPSASNSQENDKTSHYEYTHSALEGCVIVSSDKLTGKCKYMTKCPVCGKTNSGQISAYLKGGTLNSGATCQNAQCINWGKQFVVKIKTTALLIDD